MERVFSRRDAQVAVLVPEASSSKLLRLLGAKFSESKPVTDSDDWLPTIFAEGAHIADDTEENTGAEKPRCGITWPLVCASQSDTCLSEKEEFSRLSTEFRLSLVLKMKTTSPVSRVVDELLPVLKSEQVFGRNHEEKHLLSQLLAPNQGGAQLSVVSIFGVGGIGKTTLARLVYEDKTVQKHFELKAWVKVDGKELKKLSGIARQIIKFATGMSCPLDDLEELDEMVRDALLSQRSLIVLDEIESMNTDSWLHMKESWFNVVGLGSKVIITTSNKEVVNIVSSKPFELGELSQDDGWSLYSSLAFDPSKDIKNVQLIPMARRVAARCRGMPLSLKLLGSLVRFSESPSELLYSRELMDSIMSFQNISFVLSLSVFVLSPHLIQCFAYCAIFPRGYALNKEKLIKMWIADGLVKASTGMKSLEDTGDAYFHHLLCRSFFTDITCNEYGDIVQVRMPGVIHQFAQNIARIVFRGKVGVVAGLDENSNCLSLALPFGEEYNPRHLRTLISPSTKILSVTLNRSFVEFKRLQSLDLSCSGIRKLSNHISVLKKLRYLNLSHTLIRRLPNSLTGLLCLQTLDLTGCYYLKVLPKKMSNLAQLRHIDLSQCNSLSYLPSGIGLLNSLKSMPLFVLGQTRGAGLGELRKLNELRGRLLIRNLENVKEISEAQAAELKHKNLHHLGLSWSHNVDECYRVLECLQPNPKLRVLDLIGYGAYGFPSWIPTLHSLIKISIIDCRCTKLPTLGQLPFLKELLLKGLANIRLIGQEFYGDDIPNVFPSLENLKLYGMPKLYRWSSATIADGSGHSASRVFPSLKTLAIQGCPQLERLPSLPSVHDLVVWNSNSKILTSLTSIRSLSSLLINDMELGESFGGLNNLSSVKKLIVVQGTDLDALTSYHIKKFTALEHLSIQHCLKLKTATLSGLSSLQKLNIVDCENLTFVQLPTETFSLTELVIDDCPQLVSFGDTASLAACLRKLILRNCPLLSILPRKIKKLQALEYLFISGCPRLQERLQEERTQISHVPCIILEDGKF